MIKKLSFTLLFTFATLAALGPLTIDLYLPAFVNMGVDLLVPTEKIQYSLTSFFAGISLGQLIYGPVSDKYGRKKPLIFGLIVFIVASFFISQVSSLQMLVGLRFIQALGSCVGMVITRAIVRDIFSGKDIAKVFSLIILVMGVAPIIAPLLGNEILRYYDWRAIFIILGVFGIIAFVGTTQFINETLKESIPFKVSFRNYYDLLFERQFMIATLIRGTTSAIMFTYISSSAFVFLDIFKLEANTYPIIFGLNACGFIVLSQVNVKLLNHYSIERILNYSHWLCFLASLGLIGVCLLNLGVVSFIIFLFLTISSMGLILPNISAKALEFQQKRAAVASAMMGSIQFMIPSFATILITYFSDASYWPMALGIFFFAILSLGLYHFGIYRHIVKSSEG